MDTSSPTSPSACRWSRAIKRVATRPLDVHLMIEEPDRYIEAFVEAGAAMVSVHVEAVPHLHRTVHFIKGLGAKAGVVTEPGDPGRRARGHAPATSTSCS